MHGQLKKIKYDDYDTYSTNIYKYYESCAIYKMKKIEQLGA